MNIIKKIILFIKNIFIRPDEVKKLQEPKIAIEQNNKSRFLESLKTTVSEKETKRKVETLTCNGDGLGIQKKINY